jgi:FkbM family methyltransferase
MNKQVERWMHRARKARGAWRLRTRRPRRTWIDVGAHEGETTIRFAAARPDLLVYAFEPNLAVASRIMGRLRNYVVIPMAVALKDGSAELKLNAVDAASSLLEMDEKVAAKWIGGASELSVVNRQVVPTMRLDTFMTRMGIDHVHFLKVDTQGADLDVVRSAGNRLVDIDRIQMEVTKGDQLYQGAARTEEVLSFMAEHGFKLVEREDQTFGQEENLTFVRNQAG